jgi:DNA repair protein RadC
MHETLWVAHLNRELGLLHLTGYPGDADGVEFPLRCIVADALRHGSAAIILAHNHPSSDPRPSLSDCRATRRLATVADALDCRVLDHLIFGSEERWTSFRQMGLL